MFFNFRSNFIFSFTFILLLGFFSELKSLAPLSDFEKIVELQHSPKNDRSQLIPIFSVKDESFSFQRKDHVHFKQEIESQGDKNVSEISFKESQEKFSLNFLLCEFFEAFMNNLILDNLEKKIYFYPSKEIKRPLNCLSSLYVDELFFPLFEDSYLNRTPLFLERIFFDHETFKRECFYKDVTIDLILYYSLSYQSMLYCQSNVRFPVNFMSLFIATIVLRHSFKSHKNKRSPFINEMDYEMMCQLIVRPLLEKNPFFVNKILSEKGLAKDFSQEGVEIIINNLLRKYKLVMDDKETLFQKESDIILDHQKNIDLYPFYKIKQPFSKDGYIIFAQILSLILVILTLFVWPQNFFSKPFILSVFIVSTVVSTLLSFGVTSHQELKKKLFYLFFFSRKKNVSVYLLILSFVQLIFSVLIFKYFFDDSLLYRMVSFILLLLSLFVFMRVLVGEFLLYVKGYKKVYRQWSFNGIVFSKKIKLKRLLWIFKIYLKEYFNLRHQKIIYRWNILSLFIFVVIVFFSALMSQFGQDSGFYVFLISSFFMGGVFLIQCFKKILLKIYQYYCMYKIKNVKRNDKPFFKYRKSAVYDRILYRLGNFLRTMNQDSYFRYMTYSNKAYLMVMFVFVFVEAILFLLKIYLLADHVIVVMNEIFAVLTILHFLHLVICLVVKGIQAFRKGYKKKVRFYLLLFFVYLVSFGAALSSTSYWHYAGGTLVEILLLMSISLIFAWYLFVFMVFLCAWDTYDDEKKADQWVAILKKTSLKQPKVSPVKGAFLKKDIDDERNLPFFPQYHLMTQETSRNILKLSLINA